MPHAYDPWSHHQKHAPVEEETEEDTEGEVTGEEQPETGGEEDEPCESEATQLEVDFDNFRTYLDYEGRPNGFGEVVVGTEISILGPLARDGRVFIWDEPAADGAFTFSIEGSS